ncbi:PREDICTED: uncharacterized protein LOC109162435 [Ipomoea nil]|uniref:uncharacterized protein LOC109162435 n=1 Tax=Ipomoea nil TaxID=35883 RepID=UPI000901BB3B|nr:PREDICTED: uncharacterized protein LOC109162435 [Ipomoea nil]
MRAIGDDLALAASPVSEDDLVFYVITQLGGEYNPCFSAIRIRENPISFAELSNILTAHERLTRATDDQRQTMLATANIAQKGDRRTNSKTNNSSRDQSGQFSRRSRGGFNGQNNRFSWNNSNNGRNAVFCRFYNCPGHETRFCRRLARFLKDNNVCPSQAPTSTYFLASNATMASVPLQQPWLFDNGASHHATSTSCSLQTFAYYGGPDKIHLGDGKSLKISHTGHTTLPTPKRNLSLANVLCVPKLRNNLVSISKLCKTNRVFVEFFPSFFLVKDLQMQESLMRGENANDVYYATLSRQPQVHVATVSFVSDWHHRQYHG